MSFGGYSIFFIPSYLIFCHKETYKALQTSTKKDKKRKELCYFSACRFYDLTQSELRVDLPGGFVDCVL